MRLANKAIAAAALLSVSPLSFAAVYLGGSGLVSAYKYDDTKSGFGGSAFIGYRPETIPMVFEAGYLDTGKNKIDGSVVITGNNTSATVSNMSLSFAGEYFALGYYGTIDRKGSGFYGKAGFYTGKAKSPGFVSGIVNGNNVNGTFTPKETSSGAMLSVGFDWMATPYFGLRGSIGTLLRVKAVPTTDEKSDVVLANLGVIFAFGGSHPEFGHRNSPVYSPAASAPVYSAPADAPVYSPPLPPEPEPAAQAPLVQAPAPAVAPAPQPAPAVASSGTAQLVPGAVLRAGPTMKSEAIKSLPNGGSVKLLKRETNAEGPWWMVQLEDGTTGWMIEWGLARISKR